MSTQGRTSDQPELTPQSDAATATPATGEGTNLLHRWVRLVQQSTLWGNDAGQLRLDELAQGPTTPRIQTLEEIRAARTAAVAEEEAAEGAGSTSWWDDAVCADEQAEGQAVEEVCETEAAPPVEEPQVCELDEPSGEFGEGRVEDSSYALEPERAEMPPIFTLPPLVTPPTTLSPVPPVLPAAGEGLLGRILTFGARWLGPVVVGMWPKPTAPPELDQMPYTGPKLDGPTADPWPETDDDCVRKRVPHGGGHDLHDMCADTLPGNVVSGSDLYVAPAGEKGWKFDAYTPDDNTLWEVKTDRYERGSEWLKYRRLNDQADEFQRQAYIANKCNHGFKVSVSDLEQALLLQEILGPVGIDVEHRGDCP